MEKIIGLKTICPSRQEPSLHLHLYDIPELSWYIILALLSLRARNAKLTENVASYILFLHLRILSFLVGDIPAIVGSNGSMARKAEQGLSQDSSLSTRQIRLCDKVESRILCGRFFDILPSKSS